jgi:hypothetical protein
MSSVVQLKKSNPQLPARHPFLSPKTYLVALFSDDRTLVSFAKYLYRQYEIVTLEDWDAYGPGLLKTYPLNASSKRKFIKCVGSPGKPNANSGAGAKVLFLRPQTRATLR